MDIDGHLLKCPSKYIFNVCQNFYNVLTDQTFLGHGANTDILNPIVPKAHNSECQNLLPPLQIKPVKASLADFYFLHPAPALMG